MNNMNTLVIYDSNFGNTKIIAESIAKGIGEGTKVIPVSDYKDGDLNVVDLLVLGSPILAWRPSEKTNKFLSALKELNGLKFTTFDTRIKIFIHGDAANKMAKVLKSLGGNMITDPEYFYVNDKEGPLLEGEVERAFEWGKEIVKKVV